MELRPSSFSMVHEYRTLSKVRSDQAFARKAYGGGTFADVGVKPEDASVLVPGKQRFIPEDRTRHAGLCLI
jgi:hypothetical protein